MVPATSRSVRSGGTRWRLAWWPKAEMARQTGCRSETIRSIPPPRLSFTAAGMSTLWLGGGWVRERDLSVVQK